MARLKTNVEEAEFGQSGAHGENMRPDLGLGDVDLGLAGSGEHKLEGVEGGVALGDELLKVHSSQLFLCYLRRNDVVEV